MCANGFPEFLTNLDDAASEFSTALDELAALAEAAINMGSQAVWSHTPDNEESHDEEA